MMARPIVSAFISVKDAPGSESVMRLHVPNNTDIGNFKIFAQNVAGFIDAIIKGKITNISIGVGVDLPAGIKSAADATADVEDGARFIFNAANGGTFKMRLPTFDEAKMVTGSDLVNTTDTNVAAFLNEMIVGETISLQAQHPSADDQSDLVSLKSAKSAFTSERPA